MKNYYAFLIIVLLAISIQSYSSDTTYTQVKLQLKWKHQFQFAGYYAAIEQGYYKELGIEVELVEANNIELPIDALINGKAQFATSTSDIVLMRAAGNPVVLLSTIFQHSAQVLLVSDTSKIEYVHNLVGKRLIIEPHAADIIAYMKDEGVPLNRVIQMPHSFNINMLVENKADAMTAYLTDEPFLLQQQSFNYKIFSPVSGNIDFYGDILITTEQLLKDNPQLALDFRTASLKGWEYAMKNSDEIIELIYNKYSKRHSKEHLAYEAEQMKKLIMANIVPVGYSNPRRWEKTVKIYQEIGLLDTDANINGLFYTDYINKLNIPWKIIIPFSVIFLFLSSIVFFFYRITKKLKVQIKQNKNISNTLIETEKQYQTYFDQGMLGMAKTSLEKGWLEANDIICNMFGYSREEFFKLTWDKMTYPDDLEKDLLQFKRVQENEIDSYSMDKRFFRKNGDIFYSSLTVNAVRKTDGSIDYMIAILNDITERKKAEQALKESEEKFRSFIEDNKAIMLSVDASTNKILVANKAAVDFYGYPKAELINKSMTEINILPVNEINKLIGEAKNHKIDRFHFKHKLANNEIRDIEGYPSPVKVGDKIQLLVIIFDVTKRKKAEQAVKVEHARFKEILDVNPSGIYIVDKKHNIEYINPVIEKEFGQINGRKCYSYFHDLTKPCEWCRNKEVFAGKSVRWELFFEKNNKYYDIFDMPITNPDGTVSKFEIFFDITESKKAEQALKESERKLRESNKTKDKFFSIIAHDLKSPFNAILGFSEILLEKHKKYDDEKREEMISYINSSALRAFKLLENLLTWSHSQSNGINYSPENFHLKILLFETISDLQAQADKKNIQILDTISENELIYADKNMLATILRNLISNAIKFTSNSGTIIISSEKQKATNFLEISVEDTGVGIPKDRIDNLFRIDKNTSTQGTENEIGTGLGLILCKEFVEKYNGKIWVESEEGKGSTFLFTIPNVNN